MIKYYCDTCKGEIKKVPERDSTCFFYTFVAGDIGVHLAYQPVAGTIGWFPEHICEECLLKILIKAIRGSEEPTVQRRIE